MPRSSIGTSLKSATAQARMAGCQRSRAVLSGDLTPVAHAPSEGRADQLGVAGKLCRDRRHKAALGGDLHRTRQGADASALRQLPPGRRSPAPDRSRPAAPAAGRRGADGHGLPAMRCSICHQRANFEPGPHAGPSRNGTSHRARWRGKARRSARSARRSRIPNAMAAGACEDLVHHIGDDTLVGWAWAPGFGRQPAPGTQKMAGALVEAWVKTGAACP